MLCYDLLHQRYPVDTETVYPIENFDVATVLQQRINRTKAVIPQVKLGFCLIQLLYALADFFCIAIGQLSPLVLLDVAIHPVGYACADSDSFCGIAIQVWEETLQVVCHDFSLTQPLQGDFFLLARNAGEISQRTRIAHSLG